jgi:hypothetical protein
VIGTHFMNPRECEGTRKRTVPSGWVWLIETEERPLPVARCKGEPPFAIWHRSRIIRIPNLPTEQRISRGFMK